MAIFHSPALPATSGSGWCAPRPSPVSNTAHALEFTLITYSLEDAVQAHIHIGPADENGPVVVFLFGPEADGVIRDGILSEGTITEDDLIPVADVFDGTMTTLIDNLRAGTAYVNVHTLANPSGEVRGQIEGLREGVAGATFTDDDGNTHEADIETIAAAGIHAAAINPTTTNTALTTRLRVDRQRHSSFEDSI